MSSLQLKKALSFVSEMFKIRDILLEDLAKTVKRVEEDMEDECWRRMVIRTAETVIDVVCYYLKQTTLRFNETIKKKLTEDQISFLIGIKKCEISGEVIEMPYKISVKDNIKRTFKEFAALFGIRYIIADDKEWTECLDTIDIRHRITHPKTSTDLKVSEEDYYKASIALEWFSNKLGDLLKKCRSTKIFLKNA